MKYAFVRAHSPEFRVSWMCQVLKVSAAAIMTGRAVVSPRAANGIRFCSKRFVRSTNRPKKLTERLS